MTQEPPVTQRFTDFHKPVTIPAIQLVAPCLTGWIKADPSCIGVVGTTRLVSCRGTCLLFLRKLIRGFQGHPASRILNLERCLWKWNLRLITLMTVITVDDTDYGNIMTIAIPGHVLCFFK